MGYVVGWWFGLVAYTQCPCSVTPNRFVFVAVVFHNIGCSSVKSEMVAYSGYHLCLSLS